MQERTDTPAQALWTAAHSGNREVVARLIAEGIDVNVWDSRGRTALSLAAKGNHLAVAQDLLAAGAWVDPHEDGDVFTTPLISAAENGNYEMTVLLLKHGANPTHYGGTPIATAKFYAPSGHPNLSALLLAAEDAWRRKPRP